MANNSLERIQIPALNRPDFGRALAEQFANIDLNFQKLGGMGLGKGESGKSATFITYNLNAPFYYPTSDIDNPNDTDNVSDYYAWQELFQEMSKYSAPTLARYEAVREEVASDYQKYYELTGGSEMQYAQMCSYFLWGSLRSCVEPGTLSSEYSMTGALYNSVDDKTALGDAQIQTPVETITYKAIWLRDWFSASTSEKIKIFDNHFAEFDPGRILIAVRPTQDNGNADTLEPVGSLAYVYVDPRFRNDMLSDIYSNITTDDVDEHGESLREYYIEQWAGLEDISCVLYWEPRMDDSMGGFVAVNLFPQIYIDSTGIYWKINGRKTKFSAVGEQGPAGAAGKNLVIVERVENVYGATEENPFGTEISLPVADPTLFTAISSGRSNNEMNNYGLSDYDYAQVLDQYTNIVSIDGIRKTVTLQIGEHPWLAYNSGFTSEDVKNTYRVLRVVASTQFYKAPSDVSSEYRSYDPAFNMLATNKTDPITQELIKQLDGAACVVLPGPSYMPDRTDTTFWFSTLKAVKIKEDSDYLQLIVYCGPENKLNKSIDQHTYAGLMMSLDTYSHKRIGDNRDVARGWMIPIGSQRIRYSAENSLPPSSLFGAHVISSDAGPFTGIGTYTYPNGSTRQYGDQREPGLIYQQIYNSYLDDNDTVLVGNAAYPQNRQFIEVYDKKVLHIGSVDDYRTLDAVPSDSVDNNFWNAAVPGRKPGQGNDVGLPGMGSSDFWGKNNDAGTFVGSELHVDEPLTVTRYRDIHTSKKWLGRIEGDLVVGPHEHVNDPNTLYNQSDGGLFVGSTISYEIGTTVFESIFGEDFWNYVGNNRNFVPGYYTKFTSPLVINPSNIYRNTKRGYNDDAGLLFSGIFDDSVGARFLVGLDGLMVWDQARDLVDRNRFSVSANGDVQTMGNEVRSNSSSTHWYFHTRWDEDTSIFDEARFDFQTTDENGTPVSSVEIFNIPRTSTLQFGTAHKILFDKTRLDHVNEPSAENPDGADPNLYWKWVNFAIKDYPVDADSSDPIKSLSDNLTPDRIPMGWLVDFGFANENNVFGTSYQNGDHLGSETADLPTIIKMHADLLYHEGSAAITGLSVLPITLTRPGVMVAEDPEGTTGDTTEWARFGLQARYGLYVGPDTSRSHFGDSVDGNSSEIFESIPYRMRYFPKENISETHSTYNRVGIPSSNTTGTTGTINQTVDVVRPNTNFIFGKNDNSDQNYTTIGAWIDGGAYVGETLMVENDFQAMGAAAIGRQVRAKSFRRWKNSENNMSNNDASLWGFLLDNGFSSYNAPRHTDVKGCDCKYDGFRQEQQTPIVIDAGEWYEGDRLVRFGYAKHVSLDDNNDVLAVLGGEDNKITLFGKYPKHYAHVKTYGWFGNLVYESTLHDDKVGNVEQMGKIPSWFESMWRDTHMLDYGYQGTPRMLDHSTQVSDYVLQNCEQSIVEYIRYEHHVVVNLYIVLKYFFKQKGGNRHLRGIWGAGMGSNNHGQKLYYNLHTHLRLPHGSIGPRHSVFANTPGMLSSTNYHKDRNAWQDKGLNGPQPQQANIHWRLDPDGLIYMDNVCQGMMLVGNNINSSNGICPVVTASFTYPIEKGCVITDKECEQGKNGGANNGSEDGGGDNGVGFDTDSAGQYLINAHFVITKEEEIAGDPTSVKYIYAPSFSLSNNEDYDNPWQSPSCPIIITIGDTVTEATVMPLNPSTAIKSTQLTPDIKIVVNDDEDNSNFVAFNNTGASVLFNITYENNSGDEMGKRGDVLTDYPKLKFESGSFEGSAVYDPKVNSDVTVKIPTKLSDLEGGDDVLKPGDIEIPEIGTLTIKQGDKTESWNPTDGDKTIELDSGGDGCDCSSEIEDLKKRVKALEDMLLELREVEIKLNPGERLVDITVEARNYKNELVSPVELDMKKSNNDNITDIEQETV